MSTVPRRLLHAVELIEVQPADRLLELGCGGGVAVTLVCERLDDGTITAIDRSATQVERAKRRNEEHIASGKAAIHVAEVADAPGGPYDKVFAVNVNLFWTGPASRELQRIRAAVAPGGALYLFYEPPREARRRELATKLPATLSAAGFESTEINSPYLVGAVARAEWTSQATSLRKRER